ncbi:embryo-specific protein ATS3B [Trifolium repens]|nr:embryo-specific protein ATS3B [Trifolium repens]
MKALTLIILTFSIIVASHAISTLVTSPQTQMNLSSMLNHTQQQINETRILISAKDGFDGRCNYLITIKTSCDSPTYTKDEISLLFGDGFGAELFFSRLNNNPKDGTFMKCNIMSFAAQAACMGKICKLYLYRNGTDGWIPESVAVYDYTYPSVIFNYNFLLSEGSSGTGYNFCGPVL